LVDLLLNVSQGFGIHTTAFIHFSWISLATRLAHFVGV